MQPDNFSFGNGDFIWPAIGINAVKHGTVESLHDMLAIGQINDGPSTSSQANKCT